jgi:hypothetical protein
MPPWHGAGRAQVLDRLDLDHFSAEVGQDHRGERAGPHQALRQDADTRERWPAVVHRAVLLRCLDHVLRAV